jgi:hypothetical protein
MNRTNKLAQLLDILNPINPNFDRTLAVQHMDYVLECLHEQMAKVLSMSVSQARIVMLRLIDEMEEYIFDDQEIEMWDLNGYRVLGFELITFSSDLLEMQYVYENNHQVPVDKKAIISVRWTDLDV